MNSGTRRVAIVSLISALSCASAPTTSVQTTSFERQPAEEKANTALDVRSNSGTNRGRTMYMMVRALPPDEAVTALESYEDATRMLFSSERDPNIVLGEPIFPGVPLSFELTEPQDSTVILYFFFTHPGESWRVHVPSPMPRAIVVELGTDEVQQVDVVRPEPTAKLSGGVP